MPWLGRLRAGSAQSQFRSAGLLRAGVVREMYSAVSRPCFHVQKKVNQFCIVQNLGKSNPKTQVSHIRCKFVILISMKGKH